MKDKLINLFTEEISDDEKVEDIVKKEKNKLWIIKYLIVYIITFTICMIELPYYIEAPGGLDKIGDNINIENQYKSKGSINLTYVSEYPGKLPLLIYAYFNKDWKIISKKEDKIGTLDYDSLRVRQYVLARESYSNAVVYALEKAKKDVKVLEHKVYATYIFEDAKTDIKVGDQIIEVEGTEIKDYYVVRDILKKHKVGDKLTIKVLRGNKKYTRTCELIEYEKQPIMGIGFNIEYIYESNPKITIDYDKREMGPSGGLMISLYVYNSLVKEDITGGKIIVGTGTLDSEGNVGEIGGIEYKLKGAVKKKADVFFAPSGENYEDAMKLKKKRGYKIEIIEVKTFDDALNYLLNNVVKK